MPLLSAKLCHRALIRTSIRSWRKTGRTLTALTLLLFGACTFSLHITARGDEVPAAPDQHLPAGSLNNANGHISDGSQSPAWLPGPQPLSFRSALFGAPDFLQYDVPFIAPVIVADVKSEVSDESHSKRQSNIQLVSADSTTTFLRARNSGNTSIATATDETPQQVAPQNNSVPLPSDAAGGGNGGNVTVIPAQAAAPVAQGVQNPAPEVPPAAENKPPVNTPAEIPVPDAAAPSITLETIAAQRTAADQLPDLSDEVKAQLATSFQHAADVITQKSEIDRKIAELKAEKENGPTKIAEIRALLNQPPPKSEPEFPLGASVSELDQLRLADDEKAAEAQRNLEAWDAKAKIRAEKKPQMPALIETTRKELADAEKAVSIAAPDGELPVLGAARRLDQAAIVLLLKSQLELYRVEQIRYEALNELFPLQRDLLTRIKNAADKRVEMWKTILADARRDESARQAQEAREKLRNAHPTLRD
ncbi:MAG: hypothetical protein KDB01_26435, partial [Planctomycetaceae bacterium]|nr:hypothetical protein [Planctomycetaceae bacterium]